MSQRRVIILTDSFVHGLQMAAILQLKIAVGDFVIVGDYIIALVQIVMWIEGQVGLELRIDLILFD